jgi:hypothetical protein
MDRMSRRFITFVLVSMTLADNARAAFAFPSKIENRPSKILFVSQAIVPRPIVSPVDGPKPVRALRVSVTRQLFGDIRKRNAKALRVGIPLSTYTGKSARDFLLGLAHYHAHVNPFRVIKNQFPKPTDIFILPKEREAEFGPRRANDLIYVIKRGYRKALVLYASDLDQIKDYVDGRTKDEAERWEYWSDLIGFEEAQRRKDPTAGTDFPRAMDIAEVAIKLKNGEPIGEIAQLIRQVGDNWRSVLTKEREQFAVEAVLKRPGATQARQAEAAGIPALDLYSRLRYIKQKLAKVLAARLLLSQTVAPVSEQRHSKHTEFAAQALAEPPFAGGEELRMDAAEFKKVTTALKEQLIDKEEVTDELSGTLWEQIVPDILRRAETLTVEERDYLWPMQKAVLQSIAAGVSNRKTLADQLGVNLVNLYDAIRYLRISLKSIENRRIHGPSIAWADLTTAERKAVRDVSLGRRSKGDIAHRNNLQLRNVRNKSALKAKERDDQIGESFDLIELFHRSSHMDPKDRPSSELLGGIESVYYALKRTEQKFVFIKVGLGVPIENIFVHKSTLGSQMSRFITAMLKMHSLVKLYRGDYELTTRLASQRFCSASH